VEQLMRRRKTLRNKGITIAELAVALVVGLPPIFLIIYACLEANLLFTIRTNLDAATRRAAQLLITNYEMNGTAAADTTNGNLPAGLAFDVLANNGQYYIRSNANQFTWTWDLVDRPMTITVTTSYPTGGAHGLVKFPFPDPLNLGSKFTIVTSATFPIPPPS
jgi:hypothetical protein